MPGTWDLRRGGTALRRATQPAQQREIAGIPAESPVSRSARPSWVIGPLIYMLQDVRNRTRALYVLYLRHSILAVALQDRGRIK
jgi:hypothetical protein